VKKRCGDDYEESCVKYIWNSKAKLLQEKYFGDCGIKMDSFLDITFREARVTRDSKRRKRLLSKPEPEP
jgi:hypothetical protein